MSNNYFDTLPSDVKIHLFSFLSAKDLVAITSVNRSNKNLQQNIRHAFVWSRLQSAFGINVMQDVDPILLHRRLLHERSTLIAYLGAVDCLSEASACNHGLSRDTKQVRRAKLVVMLDKLDDSLKTLPDSEFIVIAAAIAEECMKQYGAVDHRALYVGLHTQLVMSKETPVEMMRKMFGNQLFRAPEARDREMIAIQRMMVYLSRCGASTSMGLFFKKLPELWQSKIWKAYSSSWNKDAASFNHPATQRKLIELHRQLQRKNEGDESALRLVK